MGRQLYTQNGYPLAEVISALQKEVRRGNEADAMYWALELLPRYEAYFWRRLQVIANEDIGIANLPVLALVPVQRDFYYELRERGQNGTAMLPLANIILAMCRSPKSRIADHFQCAMRHRWQTTRAEIPDYAFDKHTSRGKRMGRDVNHFLEEGTRLSDNGETVNDPYGEDAAQVWRGGHVVELNWGKRRPSGRSDAVVEEEMPTQLDLF